MNFWALWSFISQTFIRSYTSIKESWRSINRFLVSLGCLSSLLAFFSSMDVWMLYHQMVYQVTCSKWLRSVATPRYFCFTSSTNSKLGIFTNGEKLPNHWRFSVHSNVHRHFDYNETVDNYCLGMHPYITCIIVSSLNMHGNPIPIPIWKF